MSSHRNRGTVPRQGNLEGFLSTVGALYAGSLMPKTSISEFEYPACQDNKIRQLCPELLNESCHCLSQWRPHLH